MLVQRGKHLLVLLKYAKCFKKLAKLMIETLFKIFSIAKKEKENISNLIRIEFSVRFTRVVLKRLFCLSG